eukprot:TRINITY_DN17400_c0_g1_i1.p1 TRINITY_DN17400_c0_g1~~TRINITY_DN17400_c0_g1_i1.p1  ORF type:complete len:783 (+),score=161.13 TRINITY_DN17400_c0_g1_i1:309-2351(+)
MAAAAARLEELTAAAPDHESTGRGLFFLGIARAELGDVPGAIAAYEQCEQWHRRGGHAAPLAVSENLAVAHATAARHHTASVYAERWASAAASAEQRREASSVLGSALLWAGSAEQGDAAYARALLHAEEAAARERPDAAARKRAQILFDWAQERELFGVVAGGGAGWLACNRSRTAAAVAASLAARELTDAVSPDELVDACATPSVMAERGWAHYEGYIRPQFEQARRAAVAGWPGCSGAGRLFSPVAADASAAAESCAAWDSEAGCGSGGSSSSNSNSKHAEEDRWHAARTSGGEPIDGVTVKLLAPGGERYGAPLPLLLRTVGYTYPPQHYTARAVVAVAAANATLCGNEGLVVTGDGCTALEPAYAWHLPYHENLCPPARRSVRGAAKPRHIPGDAVSLAVPFPANFYSFLIDAVPRLLLALSEAPAATVLVPSDKRRMKPFMKDLLVKVLRLPMARLVPYPIRPSTEEVPLWTRRVTARRIMAIDWRKVSGDIRNDTFLLPPPFALRRAREQLQPLAERCAGEVVSAPPAEGGPWVLWIMRAVATTRRVAGERALLRQLAAELRPLGWGLRAFPDSPVPPMRCAIHLFQGSAIIAGLHGSGMANLLFARPGTAVIEVGLPEPHSQYAAHLCAALRLRHALIMLSGRSLHQRLYVDVPGADLVALIRETALRLRHR